MKKILPVSQPLITSYPGIAAAMAVLGTDDRYMRWIVNNYNNLVYLTFDTGNLPSMGNFYDIFYPCYGMIFEKIPFFESSRFNKKFINIICGDIKSFIIKCIDNEYYVYLALNNYYIPHSHAYRKFDFRHSTFIYGYDIENDIVNIADFYNGQKYGFYTITFEDLYDAFNDSFTEIDYDQVMNVFRVKKSYDLSSIRYDWGFISSGLTDYIRSEDKIMEYAKKDSFNGGTAVFGISYFDKLILDVENGSANIQAFHVLCDHAIITKHKIKLLYEDHLLANEAYLRLKCEIEEIEHQSIVCRNMFLKNSVIKNIKSNNKILYKLKMLKDMNKCFSKNWINVITTMSNNK